jgi:hypothetical protein
MQLTLRDKIHYSQLSLVMEPRPGHEDEIYVFVRREDSQQESYLMVLSASDLQLAMEFCYSVLKKEES